MDTEYLLTLITALQAQLERHHEGDEMALYNLELGLLGLDQWVQRETAPVIIHDMSQQRRKIANAIKEGFTSPVAITEETGLPYSSVRQLLSRMVKTQVLKRQGRGLYALDAEMQAS